MDPTDVEDSAVFALDSLSPFAHDMLMEVSICVTFLTNACPGDVLYRPEVLDDDFTSEAAVSVC